MHLNSSIFIEYDNLYSNSINKEQHHSIRVEQGEYFITSINNSIGTYNLHQCVVLYIRDQASQIHGLAHIDGHTETDSIYHFLIHFQYNIDHFCERPKVDITVFRNSQSDISGLNDPGFNFEKVVYVLNNSIYEVIDSKFPDFIIGSEGMRIAGLPVNSNYECRALHIVQEAKRSIGFMGTYEIIKGCDKNFAQEVLLDQRINFVLAKFTQNPSLYNDPSQLSLGGGVSEGQAAFIESLQYLNQVKLETTKMLNKCAYTYKYNFGDLNHYNLSFVIPDNNECANNQKLVSCLLKGKIDECKYKLIDNHNNINLALEIAKRFDSELNSTKISAYLSEYYIMPISQILVLQYDAKISATQFMKALKEANSILYHYSLINSVGHLIFSERIKIADAYTSTVFIDSKSDSVTNHALQCFIETHNKQIYKNAKDYKSKGLLIEVISNLKDELSKILSTKEFKIIKYMADSCSIPEDRLQEFLDKVEQALVQRNKSAEFPKLKNILSLSFEKLKEEQIAGKLYHKSDYYASVQHPFLSFIEPIKKSGFDELTISKIMALSGYEVKNIKHEISAPVSRFKGIDLGITPCADLFYSLNSSYMAHFLKLSTNQKINLHDQEKVTGLNFCNSELIYLATSQKSYPLEFSCSMDAENFASQLFLYAETEYKYFSDVILSCVGISLEL